MEYEQVNTIKYWAEADRPREKLLDKGRHVLTDAELIAILIGSGNRNQSAVDLSKDILQTIDNDLNELAKLSVQDLSQFNGIGEAKAISIIAALEIGRRRKNTETAKRSVIKGSKGVFDLMHPLLVDLPHEEFWVLLMNRRNAVIKRELISRGGTAGTIVDSKILFKTAISHQANGIILCHNHPSGNTQPSEADKQITKKIKEGGRLIDISILDHLIIGDDNYFSFADEELL